MYSHLNIQGIDFYTVKDSLIIQSIPNNGGTRVEFAARVPCESLAQYNDLLSIMNTTPSAVTFIYSNGILGIDKAYVFIEGESSHWTFPIIVDIRGIEVA